MRVTRNSAMRLSPKLEIIPDSEAKLDAELGFRMALEKFSGSGSMTVTDCELEDFVVRKVYEGSGVSHPHGEAIEEIAVFRATIDGERSLRVICKRGLLPYEKRLLDSTRYTSRIVE